MKSSNLIDETMASYDQTAAEFAARWGALRLEQALDTFVRHLAGRRRVLDLGCGPGRDVKFLTGLGCCAVGLDLSAGMLAQAGHRVLAAPLVRADLRHPPFAASSFDGIWACASLLHLPRAHFAPTLGELARLLRPSGGILYLAMKGGAGEAWVTGEGDRRSFFTYYQLPELETLLCQAGFQVVERWISPDRMGREHPWLNLVASSLVKI
jgi:SAM-dependent methyltransferase